MNSYERFARFMRGAIVDHPVNFDIMLTFAAHYVRKPLALYYQDYRVLCEANLAVQQT
jgi:hypothetical protein